MTARAASLDVIGRMAGLSRLSLCGLAEWRDNSFRSFFCSPNIRRLQHLELSFFFASPFDGWQAPSAADYGAVFSAMQQLQSLTLERVFGINALLPHLSRSPALRLLSIRCQPQSYSDDDIRSQLPSRSALTTLLAAAPHLEVRLLLPPCLDRWLETNRWAAADTRAKYEEQWHKLHLMAAELD